MRQAQRSGALFDVHAASRVGSGESANGHAISAGYPARLRSPRVRMVAWAVSRHCMHVALLVSGMAVTAAAAQTVRDDLLRAQEQQRLQQQREQLQVAPVLTDQKQELVKRSRPIRFGY